MLMTMTAGAARAICAWESLRFCSAFAIAAKGRP